MQSVANSFMIHTGFSIGIGHTILDSASMGSVDENIEDCLSRVAEQCKPTSSSPDPYFEQKLASSLVQSWSCSGSIVAQWTRRKTKNSAIMMAAKSHSRRLAYASEKAFTDIIRASACVGQQFVGNGFIPMGFRDRTLPHFTKHAIRPEAWGFVKNSYLRGLTPQEFFFNAMVGRAYILHVAGEKAEAMRVQRNLVKSLEDVMVCYDGTVRNSSGDVIQFVYGEDGFDPTCLESQTIDTFGEIFDSKYGRLQVGTEFSELKAKLDQEFAQLIRDRQLIGELFHDKCRYHRFSLPLNLPRLLQEAIVKFGIDSSNRQVDDLEPKHIIDTINNLCNRLILSHGEDVVRMFCMQFRATLETGRVLKEFYLSRAAFDWVLTEAEHRFRHSFVNPGEMCGLLAAQGFGEALTQRLPGFAIYRPGSSLWKRPVVIERFKEIIYASDVIDEASLTVHLERTSSTGSWEQALIVRRQLPFVVLRDITSATEIWYDPDPNLTVIEEDTLFVEAFFAIPDEDIALELQSPWLIRLELDRRKICDHGLTLNFVASCITQKFGSKVAVIWSEECSDKLIIRCRVLTDIMENMNDFFTVNLELHRLTEDILDSTVLGGIPGIDRVFLMPYSPVKDGIVLHESEWLIETLGTNLKATLAVEGVDFTRTYSNDCIETCRVLGIEAARAILLQELHYIVGYAKVGQVERRHLVLLCDFMTRHGFIKSMRCPSNVGTLVQSAPSSRGFLEATLRGKQGFLGLTESLILGKIRRMGSGSMDILIDPSVL
ncbi:DNA-directed RNA polymerase II core subunit rpo21 [Stygiomarasmius scandens]|uniref:DNA-directed RNA polymerase n=1 Tax=Marasmiellus scandens TaxID=2682957 RepID=A0ABR1J4C2_9AGAR